MFRWKLLQCEHRRLKRQQNHKRKCEKNLVRMQKQKQKQNRKAWPKFVFFSFKTWSEVSFSRSKTV